MARACPVPFGLLAVLVGCLPSPPSLDDLSSTTVGASDSTGEPPPDTTTELESSTGTSAADTTVGPDDDGDSSTGPIEPPCCHAGCDGTCAREPCLDVELGVWPGEEAIGVAVVGDTIVWSTGTGRSLRMSGPRPGTDQNLVDVRANAYVTRIVADGEHVYFLDWGGPTVKRASVRDGAIDVVTEVAGGQAGFGAIVVGAEHVYFGMRTTNGIWRAAKDLSEPQATLVAEAMDPSDIALDDVYVYWSDAATQQVLRLDFSRTIGRGASGQVVYDGSSISTLAVDDEALFIGDGDSVVRVDKLGTNEGIVTLAVGQGWVWELTVDEVHAYWTSADLGRIGRARKDGRGRPEMLAETSTPWGLDVSCDSVYWAAHDSSSLRGRLK
jgi:hypothetical protein